MIVLAALVFARFTAPAFAATQVDDVKARATGKLVEAESLFNQDRFADSLQRLEEARALYPSPKIAFNLGKTYRALGRDADALAAFEQFLAEADRADPVVAERRPEAEQQVRELRDKRVVPTPRVVPEPPEPAVKPAAVAPVAPAPEPVPAARTIDLSLSAPPPTAATPPVYRRWWFWTGAATIVAGAITAALILWGPDDSPPVCSTCGLGEFRVNPGAKK